MHTLYQTYGSGDLKANPNKAFEMTKDGPVVILSRTQPKAVMVSPEEWNLKAKRLAELELFFQAMEVSSRMDADPSLGTDFDELCNRLGIDPDAIPKRDDSSS